MCTIKQIDNMSKEKTDIGFEDSYNDIETNLSEMEDWILANCDSPELDSMMMDLLDKTEYFDPVISSHGYSQFKTKIKDYERTCRKERLGKVIRKAEHVAAILLLPLCALMFYLGGSTSDVEWLEANTSSGQELEIMLPDGSEMTLGPSSKIIYPSNFNGDQRKVFVMGSVYADIETDPEHPFVVSSGALDVIVYGTEFHLNSYDSDSEVEVALVEGSVKLHNKTDHRDINMRPGDIVCYDKSSGNFIRKNFAAGYYKDILEKGGFHFVNQRLGDIASTLERHFGVTIYIEDASISDERYFASFINNESVDDILNVLNAQNYMKITRNGKIIHITH